MLVAKMSFVLEPDLNLTLEVNELHFGQPILFLNLTQKKPARGGYPVGEGINLIFAY